jgi:hypothetical protein
MGQSIAVTFACIYMSMLELKCFTRCLLLNPNFEVPLYYKRFIDDIFSIWRNKQDAILFESQMNKNMHPNISITSTISTKESIFLDVLIYKGTLFSKSKLLDIRLFQKPINKYQYIPHSSFHTKFVFKSFISAELHRYLIKCTNAFDFLNMRKLFFGRLFRRGYTSDYLNRIFEKFPLNPSEVSILREQQISKLMKKYSVLKQDDDIPPLVYKSCYNIIHKYINLHKILRPSEEAPLHMDPDWHLITDRKNPIICYTNNISIGGLLNRSK